MASVSVFEEFHTTATDLWNEYLKVGPGKLTPQDLEPLQRASKRVSEARVGRDAQDHTFPRNDWKAEFDALVAVVEPLLRRCATRPEGLCFVTGEAGLIANQQLHRQCSESLARLSELISEMRSST